MINQVTVIYVSGVIQVIKLGVHLPCGSGEVLRLNQEPIQRIVVYIDRFGAYGLPVRRSWSELEPGRDLSLHSRGD